MTTKEKLLQTLHKYLRECRYYYYEKHESLISDYSYDQYEKRYDELCDELKITSSIRLTNFVGYTFRIPMNIIETQKLYD